MLYIYIRIITVPKKWIYLVEDTTILFYYRKYTNNNFIIWHLIYIYIYTITACICNIIISVSWEIDNISRLVSSSLYHGISEQMLRNTSGCDVTAMLRHGRQVGSSSSSTRQCGGGRGTRYFGRLPKITLWSHIT